MSDKRILSVGGILLGAVLGYIGWRQQIPTWQKGILLLTSAGLVVLSGKEIIASKKGLPDWLLRMVSKRL